MMRCVEYAQAMSSYMTNASTTPGNGSPEESAQILLDMVTYITANAFQLIDFTGRATTWGDW
jgi:hypothetical protein